MISSRVVKLFFATNLKPPSLLPFLLFPLPVFQVTTSVPLQHFCHLSESLVVFRPPCKNPKLISDPAGGRLNCPNSTVLDLSSPLTLDKSLPGIRWGPLATRNPITVATATVATPLLLIVLTIPLRA